MLQALLIALVAFILAGVVLSLAGVPYAWALALVIAILVFLGGYGGQFRRI